MPSPSGEGVKGRGDWVKFPNACRWGFHIEKPVK